MTDNFTFVTIGLTDETSELTNTYYSISSLLNEGASWIVVLKDTVGVAANLPISNLIVGQDRGLYDALNIGMSAVETSAFMFLHSGDLIIRESFLKAYRLLDRNDIVLGGSSIGNRVHLSKKWSPWMFYFYVQPPHLPILYKKDRVQGLKFSSTIKVVADFYFLQKLFHDKLKWVHSKELYVKMNTGGLTTNGLSSVRLVTKSFMNLDGPKALFVAPFRLILKLIIS